VKKLTVLEVNRRGFLGGAGGIAAGLALGGTISAPAIAQGAQAVTLRLDFLPQGYHAPLFYGVKKGYYKDSGIDLQINDGKGSTVALQSLSSGNDMIAIANYATVVQSVAAGMPIIGIGGMIQQLPDAVISHAGSGIKTPKDMEGQTMSIPPKSGVFRLFQAFCSSSGVDINKIKQVQVDPAVTLQLFMSKQVNFSTAWVFTDASRLALQTPMEKPILMADHGVNVLGNGFTVRKDTMASQSDMLRRFMAATTKSYADGLADAKAAAAAMAEARPAANDVTILERECREMKPFTYTKRSESLGFGQTTKEDWEETIQVVSKYFGGVEKAPALSDLFTDQFLVKKAS
jgi:NitT/TauT family transport system substrate-binding protein